MYCTLRVPLIVYSALIKKMFFKKNGSVYGITKTKKNGYTGIEYGHSVVLSIRSESSTVPAK
jgi:hypothetical protein